MIDLPPKVVAAIDECAKQWGAPTVARKHLSEIARLAIEEALPESERELALANARIDYLCSPDSSHSPEVSARNAALEEAAVIADRDFGEDDVARAIRALKRTRPEGGQSKEKIASALIMASSNIPTEFALVVNREFWNLLNGSEPQ